MAEEEKELVKETEHEDVSKRAKKKFEKYESEIELLKTQVEYWKNEYYRAYADTKNLRSSLEKDHQEAMKYRSEGFIDELLPVLDSFHIVLSNEPEDPVLKNYLVGFQFIYRNLVSVLENEGVKEITPNIGDKFDPKTMNAVDVEESEQEDNTITKVLRKGYMLHDRIVRPVMVNVAGKKKEEPQENQNENNEESK